MSPKEWSDSERENEGKGGRIHSDEFRLALPVAVFESKKEHKSSVDGF